MARTTDDSCAEGERSGDEIFIHDEGSWNISRIRRAIAARPQEFPVERVPLDQDLLNYVATNIQPDPTRIAALPASALAEPAIAGTLESGRGLLIDGHHRLLRLAGDGASLFDLVLLDAAATKRFRID